MDAFIEEGDFTGDGKGEAEGEVGDRVGIGARCGAHADIFCLSRRQINPVDTRAVPGNNAETGGGVNNLCADKVEAGDKAGTAVQQLYQLVFL